MSAIEVTAFDIESAIEQGLKQLNLIRAEVKIEVLDEGSRGVLGIGARPARVRLTPFADIEGQASPTVAAPEAPPAQPTPATPAPQPTASEADADRPPAPQAVSPSATAPEAAPAAAGPDEDVAAPKIEGEDLALELTRDILQLMGLRRATISAHSIFPSDSDEEPSIWVDVRLAERDEELLIRHQHEGLNALQTIVQTVWSHRTRSSLRVNVDVNGFRRRREQKLTNMARRLAEKVVADGKPITLEPMPANERRIVHLALRNQPGVFTESFGEGAARKVQIKPKK